MNLRLTLLSAFAVLLASLSLGALIDGDSWLVAEVGALLAVAAAGMLTRSTSLGSAVATTFLVLIAVVPLLSDPNWAARIGGIAIVVITAASAAGPRFRGVSVLACYLACLLIYLNLVFAPSLSYGLVIPNNQSAAALGRLCQDAFNEFKYAPPVPDSRGLALVVAGGVGLVAILVDLLAVRLRQPAVAGLPLLVLFSVPVASNLKTFGIPQMAVFAAALAGYLSLLSADGRDRLRMWGRLVTFRHVQSADEAGSGPDTRDLAASGRRIGLAAVCLAIAIPVIVPSLHTRDVFGTTNDGNGSGSGHGGVALSPLLRVQNELEGSADQVLTYTTTATDPHEQYLQAYVLNYNAKSNQWTPSYTDSTAIKQLELPAKPPGVLPSTPELKFKTTVTYSKTSAGFAILPMPYAPVDLSVRGPGGWDEVGDSLMVYNSTASLEGLSYTVWSDYADPANSDIPAAKAPAAVINAYGSYQGPQAQKLKRLAEQIIDGATTPFEKAYALEEYFHSSGTFTYTLHPNLPATNWLWTFLTKTQKGYCTQFAQAFAVLGRLLGLPTRIAVGYTAGTKGKNGVWDVTTADAHAWPEVYFTGVGWLRFEPTPTGLGGQGTGFLPPYAGGPAATGPGHQGLAPITGTNPSGQGNDARIGKDTPFNRFAHPDASEAGLGGRSHKASLWPAIVIPAIIVLLLVWPALTRLVVRRRRWRRAAGDAGLADAAWREVTDDLTDYGIDGPPGETPRGLARRVITEAGLSEAAADALRRVTAAAERARYARLAQPGAGLQADVLTVRRAVAAAAERRQRLRARLMPTSTLLAAWHLTQRGSEMLGWLDTSWPTVRRQLSRAVARRTAGIRASGKLTG
jgi:transglutaminase-like putative cysteine protease